MNTWIDALIFVSLYSNIPFYITQQYNPITGSYLLLEFPLDPLYRFFCWNCLATTFFLVVHFTEYRQKYMFWHLEKRRKFSGFHPLEITLATFYHTFYLCFLTEIFITILDGSFLKYYSHLWFISTGNKLVNVFFTSFLMHLLMEISGWNDTLRIGYYQR